MSSTPSDINEERSLRLNIGDERLDDFVLHDLNVETIVEWANCRDKETKRNRIRFIETFPIFVPMLVWNSDDPFASEITEWIDDGEPLVENIAGLMGDVSPDTIQFLIGKPLSLITGEWIDDELELVFALSCVPQDSRPQSKADWTVFAEYCHAIQPVPWDASGHFFRELCCLGYGPEHAEKLGFSHHELHKLYWVNDYIAFLTSWAKTIIDSDPVPTSNVVPFSRNSMRHNRDEPRPVDAWVNKYFSSQSAEDILNQVLAWRGAFRNAVAIVQSESNDPELVQWPALLRQPFVVNQVRVRSITTVEDAIQDGAALALFDDDYIESCTLGDDYLVALNDPHGNHISSAMIHLISDGGQIFPYIGAHHRPNGDYAHQQDDEVLEKALDWLRLAEQQSWLQALVTFNAVRREKIREKLDVLDVLNLEVASLVLRKVLVDFEGAKSELSGLRN